MDFNLIDNVEYCLDLINDSYPLGLIYYSHVLSGALSLNVGVFVFLKNRKSLVAKLLLALSVTFTFWLICNQIAWTSSNGALVIFAWSFFGMLTASLFLLCLYLSYVFLFQKDIGFFWKLLMGIALLPVVVMTSTRYNVVDFSILNDCEVTENPYFSTYYYFIGLTAFFLILAMVIVAYAKADKRFKKQIAIFAIGVEIFILLFFLTGFWGTLTGNYNIEFYGILSMALFMGLLGYMIVKYGAFNVKMLSVQAIMIVLILLIASEHSLTQDFKNRILTGLALVFSIVFGWQLVNLIKREVEQKDELSRVNQELDHMDKTKNEFINIASHQLRTPLTVIKGVMSLIQSGEMEKLDEEMRKSFLDGAMKKCQKLDEIVNDILNATTLANSKYSVTDEDTEDIDVKDFFMALIEGFMPELLVRDMELSVGKMDVSANVIQGQKMYLEEAFANIISNAIKYTPSLKGSDEVQVFRERKGKIVISNKREGEFLIFSVKDNGIGIPKEEIPDLFKKFYRATNASAMYVDGSGLGLFIVKEIVEGHGGKIWVESELDKGTEFFVKLPIKQKWNVDIRTLIEERAEMEM